MTLNSATVALRLAELENRIGAPNRFVVALSGGLDSIVLTHCVAAAAKAEKHRPSVPVIAAHVDHGLHVDSGDWRQFCATFADEHGIEFCALEVSVSRTSGQGLEAAARDARLQALETVLRPGDWLLTAHHREDQAETLMINMIRGSGPAGIAGIASARCFGPGWLVRPLLEVDKAAIEAYAEANSLQWVEDPSNEDRQFDRNYLRHEVLPVLKNRWSNIAQRLQRTTTHATETVTLLADLARMDLDFLGGCAARLPINGLKTLSVARQCNLLRFALRELRYAAPPAQQLERIVSEVIPARIDAEPRVSWAGACARRYRDGLYLLPESLAACIKDGNLTQNKLDLGYGLGSLELVKTNGIGVSIALVEAGLTVRSRVGGEEIKPQGQAHTRKLKKLLQEDGVVPWMRDLVPLVYSGDDLVAVGDLWLADNALTKPGLAVRWNDRPALH